MTASPVDLAKKKIDNAVSQSFAAQKEHVNFVNQLLKMRVAGLYGMGGLSGGYTLSAIACSIYHPLYASGIMVGTAVTAAVVAIRASYSKTDIDQREYDNLISEARKMRREELELLDQEIERNNLRQSDSVELKNKRNYLANASNIDLIKWAFPLSKIAKDTNGNLNDGGHQI